MTGRKHTVAPSSALNAPSESSNKTTTSKSKSGHKVPQRETRSSGKKFRYTKSLSMAFEKGVKQDAVIEEVREDASETADASDQDGEDDLESGDVEMEDVDESGTEGESDDQDSGSGDSESESDDDDTDPEEGDCSEESESEDTIVEQSAPARIPRLSMQKKPAANYTTTNRTKWTGYGIPTPEEIQRLEQRQQANHGWAFTISNSSQMTGPGLRRPRLNIYTMTASLRTEDNDTEVAEESTNMNVDDDLEQPSLHRNDGVHRRNSEANTATLPAASSASAGLMPFETYLQDLHSPIAEEDLPPPPDMSADIDPNFQFFSRHAFHILGTGDLARAPIVSHALHHSWATNDSHLDWEQLQRMRRALQTDRRAWNSMEFFLATIGDVRAQEDLADNSENSIQHRHAADIAAFEFPGLDGAQITEPTVKYTAFTNWNRGLRVIKMPDGSVRPLLEADGSGGQNSEEREIAPGGTTMAPLTGGLAVPEMTRKKRVTFAEPQSDADGVENNSGAAPTHLPRHLADARNEGDANVGPSSGATGTNAQAFRGPGRVWVPAGVSALASRGMHVPVKP